MTIAKEEIFGPVISAIPFNDIDEVIERANKSQFGLAAGVWTENVKTAHYVASKVRAGTVWVNCYNVFDAASPFGGFKQSGLGREMGSYALNNYTEVKSVWLNLNYEKEPDLPGQVLFIMYSFKLAVLRSHLILHL